MKHNSALNADVLHAIGNDNQRGILHALLTDYELNCRQFAIYVIDCEEIACRSKEMIEELAASLDPETSNIAVPFMVLLASPMQNKPLQFALKQTIESVISEKPPLSREIKFLKGPLTELLVYA